MPSYDKYKTSKYVQKTDVDPAILVTISHVTEEDVSMNNQPTEMKFVVHFEQDVKPWVPGITMLDMIHQIAGDGDVDHWDAPYRLDHKLPVLKIVLWLDPNVTFMDKLVGGIRCRPPKNQAQAEPVVPPSREPEDEFDAAMQDGEPPVGDEDVPAF